jgi:hypothetical protein
MTKPHPLATLEITVKQLIVEHRALLVALEAHEAALRSCSIPQIERTTREQDIARQKIAATETRRRVAVHQLTRQHKLMQQATLTKLGELYPDRNLPLLTLRNDLVAVATKIHQKSMLVGQIAHSVLGHVSATLRVVAQAASGPAAYTRQGDMSLPSRRMSVLNAVA